MAAAIQDFLERSWRALICVSLMLRSDVLGEAVCEERAEGRLSDLKGVRQAGAPGVMAGKCTVSVSPDLLELPMSCDWLIIRHPHALRPAVEIRKRRTEVLPIPNRLAIADLLRPSA